MSPKQGFAWSKNPLHRLSPCDMQIEIIRVD